jgi:hypothetical protein
VSDTLHRLVYCSRNRIAGSADKVANSVRSILVAARRNNVRIDVTGALMFNAGCFAQVLEGPRAAVENLFERVQQDPRHGDLKVLDFGSVERRGFAHWSMAFVGGSAEDAACFSGIARESCYDPSCMTGEALLEALHRLALEEETATR